MYLLGELVSIPDPVDRAMLQRVFATACLLEQVEIPSPRGAQLVRFLLDEFRLGQTEEACLLECAIWFAKRRPEIPHAPSQALARRQTAQQFHGPADE
jgi:hypothetical protein